LVQAAQEGRTKITPEIVRASYEHVGIYPFNKEKILANAKSNIGELPADDENELSRYDWLVKLVSETIKESLDLKGYQELTVSPEPGKLFDGEALLHHSQSVRQKKEEEKRLRGEKKAINKAEKESKKRARDEAAQKFVCRGDHTLSKKIPVWKRGGMWIWCSTCDEFGLCPKCVKKCAEELLEHEMECRAKMQKRV
jgi:hypothetical protein